MKTNDLSGTQKLTISALLMALYVVVVFLTQSFSFGAYQVRIATALYALAFIYPFLILPLGLANCLANTLIGGLGIWDSIGGLIVGIATTALIVLLKKLKAPAWTCAIPVTFIPALGVPIYLSQLLGLPYSMLAISLLVGQAISGVCGAAFVIVLQKTALKSGAYAH
ncbi:MAG: QueT transporter family protein [Lachnospiraceae bacterium]|nr:QueT transporter family protein [Lachnospiraceae bacterium]